MISSATTNEIRTLEAHILPLKGVHLIEASAGTGKTFNITRIYLRLLLEKKLKVQNILVVTFTKAATDELRGRVDSELRSTLLNWGDRDLSDTFYASLESTVTKEEASLILREAISDLDEAAIFTIHGFCKRVLTQQAFASGLPFDLEMEVDSYELKIEAVRDWYRLLEQSSVTYLTFTDYWLTPEDFYKAFSQVLSEGLIIESNDPETIKKTFIENKQSAKVRLESNSSLVFSELIDSHKDKVTREEEYEVLLGWLSDSRVGINQTIAMPKEAAGVFDGKRYARKPSDIKAALNEIFDPLKELKKQCVKIDDQIKRAEADVIATNGIKNINKKIKERKLALASLDFDDLILSLLDSLKLSDSGALAEELLAQYPVALVDEFQDTDPNQYAIFENIYIKETSLTKSKEDYALYMIGDPKQAIYGFRGGDVFAYLAARDNADQQWYMDTNWRSSSLLINGYNRLFYGKPLLDTFTEGHDAQTTHVFKYGIGYTPVKSSLTNDESIYLVTTQAEKESSSKEESVKPLNYIYFPEHEGYGKGANNQQFRSVIADWCANEIINLLQGNAIVENDIAILVRDRGEAEDIQHALMSRNCASVYLSNRENVFKSEEALELLSVLTGILDLEDNRLFIAALATRLCGLDPEQLYKLQNDEVYWEGYRLRFIDLRNEWQRKGLMSMAFKLMHDNFKPTSQRYERSLTNLIHLLELLQHASQKHHQPWEQLSWLRDKIENQSVDSESELRLESDANLVKIITLHGSKGLEYPVVFIPYASRAKGGPKSTPAFSRYHDTESKQSISFVGFNADVQKRAEKERQAEDVRLLYVAVTRAKYLCYICATPFSDFHNSPLGLMIGSQKGGDLCESLARIVNDTPESAALITVPSDEWESNSCHPSPPIETSPLNIKSKPIVQVVNRVIENDWWIGSFSAITRNLRHGVMAEPDRDSYELKDLGKELNDQTEDMRFVLKKGAAAGNLLHDILENTDFINPDWNTAFDKPLRHFGKLEDDEVETLKCWLQECLDAKLSNGSASDQAKVLSLSALPMANTLREVEFYFPMNDTTRQDLSNIIQTHRESNVLPQLPPGNELKGMMHGFIDLIFEWQGKYYVADYKSTFLGDNVEDYSYQALLDNIQDNYYDLQYLIYCLALHRYLRLRIENYSPDKHFGGVYYLYLRGMGPVDGKGVYYKAIEPDLLNALDDLFANKTKGHNGVDND